MSLEMDDITQGEEIDQISLAYDKENSEFIDAMRKKNILWRDKFIYTLGVINSIITPYLLAAFPNYFYYWYSFKAIFLISFRWWTYKKNNWHYFLLDFCYFANVILLCYIFIFPNNPSLFSVCWSFSFGPLLWAIALWKNCMVFHSVDKITSLFIHLMPSLLCYCLRWKTSGATAAMFTLPNPETITFYDLSIFPLYFYVSWQFLYWLKVYWLGGNRSDRMTSASYLLGAKKGFIYYLCKVPFGEKNADYGFMLLQLAFTIATILPSYFFYQSELLTFIYVATMATISIWNGAQFYFEIFLERYATEIQKEIARVNEAQKKKS